MCTILWGRLHFVHDVTLYLPFIQRCHVTVFSLIFQWYDFMTKYFSRERLMQRRIILLSPQYGDTTSYIRDLVSDRLLSLILKERVYNVRWNEWLKVRFCYINVMWLILDSFNDLIHCSSLKKFPRLTLEKKWKRTQKWKIQRHR